MTLWLIIGVEAIAILFIFAMMLKKRSSLGGDSEDEETLAHIAAVDAVLPQTERWDEEEPPAGVKNTSRPEITPDLPDEERWE